MTAKKALPPTAIGRLYSKATPLKRAELVQNFLELYAKKELECCGEKVHGAGRAETLRPADSGA